MKQLIYCGLVLLISCQEPVIQVKTTDWVSTDISFENFFIKSNANKENLYLLFLNKFVSVNNDLETKEIIEFQEPISPNPYPLIKNNFLVVYEERKDSVYYSIYSILNPTIKYSLNITQYRAEFGERLNPSYETEVAAINVNDKILFVFPNFTTHTYHLLLGEIISTTNKLEIKNKILIEINELKTLNLQTITSLGEYFYLSSYNKTYQIDNVGNWKQFDNARLIGKPFEFDGKSYLKTYNGFYESEDGGHSWQRNDRKNYGFVYPLGTVNKKLFFIEKEDQESYNEIKTTLDLVEFKDYDIENETSENQFRRLHIIGNYLYGLDDYNTLHRVNTTQH